MASQIDLLAERAAENLALGLDRVSEKELLVMVLAAVKQNGGTWRGGWPHWRPRDIAVAVVAVLSALGMLGAGAGAAATKLVP